MFGARLIALPPTDYRRPGRNPNRSTPRLHSASHAVRDIALIVCASSSAFSLQRWIMGRNTGDFNLVPSHRPNVLRPSAASYVALNRLPYQISTKRHGNV
jgi:hypothetical protein